MAFTYVTTLRNVFFGGNDANRKPKNYPHSTVDCHLSWFGDFVDGCLF